MKPERAFIAERAVARHSPALSRREPSPADLMPVMEIGLERLVRAMRGALAPLVGGIPPQVACPRPEETTLEEFVDSAPSLAAWSVYAAGTGSDRLLSVVDGETLLRLVDRAFGGPGDAPLPLPRELPLSTELMVQRLEAILALRLGEALEAKPAIRPLRRDNRLDQVQPYAPGTRLVVLTVEVSEAGRVPWSMRLAIPAAALGRIVALPVRPAPGTRRRGPADPMSAPFSDMPLPVAALLVDMEMPLSTISDFAVGQVLTLPIARSVPVSVAGRTLAHGAIGAVDDRVAIQISQLS
ncbi:FliM/FliN family flagellar motor switch protein [Novosphingobium sp. FKTRR1]|uniref:FliM/FliN family flagellar motor switch protein n=1 Tax=unclassified Novosphingobium TaxID=2644732 RepID=UPI001CF0AF09|nr:FliM/FliN family flagellar motor switch protein [Novosphingobium sp. FKTRR1]